MVDQTQASATDWGLGEEALARALLSEGAGVPALYEEAIERLGRAGMAASRSELSSALLTAADGRS